MNSPQILYGNTVVLSKSELFCKGFFWVQNGCRQAFTGQGRPCCRKRFSVLPACRKGIRKGCSKCRFFPKLRYSIFISKKEKILFTFTHGYANMYLVKIGNYPCISGKKLVFFLYIQWKFVIFNYFLFLSNCWKTYQPLVENRGMVLKISCCS